MIRRFLDFEVPSAAGASDNASVRFTRRQIRDALKQLIVNRADQGQGVERWIHSRMSKNSENKNWRDSTQDEFTVLLEGLKANQDAIEDSFEYPLEDLLEYLEKWGVAACKTMRTANSDPILHYMLHFRSPAYTWQTLCGMEGHYFVDPATFRAHFFEIGSRN